MRIVYINDALAIWGGLERIIVEKVNELAERYDYEMYLLTANQGDHLIPFPLSPKVTHIDLNIQFHKQYRYHGIHKLLKKIELNRLFVHRLKEHINNINPDVIVCVRSEFASAVSKVKGNIQFVFESHTTRYAQRFVQSDWPTKLKEMINNHSVRSAQRVVALTEGDANDWRGINSHVQVIPNLVHLNSSGHYCNYDSKSVIFVGRFHAQKDISSLLKIWQIVHTRNPEWQLQIYGGYGEEREQLLPLIQKMNANINVHEPTQNIFDCYLENSIFLLTSRYEPFGLVLPEAMSCGLPVVAFDCPYGPADIITDGKDGFLIKDRNISEFAEKVCMLMDNYELRKTMGLVGIQSSQRYDASLIMPKWKDLFEQLTSK